MLLLHGDDKLVFSHSSVELPRIYMTQKFPVIILLVHVHDYRCHFTESRISTPRSISW